MLNTSENTDWCKGWHSNDITLKDSLLIDQCLVVNAKCQMWLPLSSLLITLSDICGFNKLLNIGTKLSSHFHSGDWETWEYSHLEACFCWFTFAMGKAVIRSHLLVMYKILLEWYQASYHDVICRKLPDFASCGIYCAICQQTWKNQCGFLHPCHIPHPLRNIGH